MAQARAARLAWQSDIGYAADSGITLVLWGNSSGNFAASGAAVVMEMVRGESGAIVLCP